MKILPKELKKLIDSKQWPINGDQFNSQNEVFSEEIVQEIFPEEYKLYLAVPPFQTVEILKNGREKNYWNSEVVKIDQIDPKETLIIGDFGLNTDTCLALDYRYEEPKVIKLIYNEKWVVVTESFREFSEKLELRKIIWA
jgi:hypothetical protein